MSNVSFNKDWRGFADYEYQLENWIRWSKSSTAPEGEKPPGWVNLIEHDIEYREASGEQVNTLDAERFEKLFKTLPMQSKKVLKIHLLDRYVDNLGKIRHVKGPSRKARAYEKSIAQYYRDLDKAEQQLVQVIGLS